MFADRLLRRPAVQLLCPAVPVSDDVTHVTDEDGVVGEIEQAGLLGPLRYFLLEFVAGLQKLPFDAAPYGAEPGQQGGKQDENDIVGDINTRDVESVAGLGEVVVEGQTREYDGQNTRPQPCVPDAYGDGEEEEREFP